jgi:dTDP-4-dehydrorhamnose reductase
MRILLLGSNGLVGTGIETVCRHRGVECTGLTRSELEITNKEEIEDAVNKYKPDVLINAAGIVGINPCESEPKRAFDVNTVAVANLARICEKESIILVQPSSHIVFDGAKDDYYTEDDAPNPLNTYGVSKYAAELLTRNICKKHYIVRCPTLFGPRGNQSLGFVDKVLTWIREGRELRIADDKIDSPTYTLDAADTIISLLAEEKPFGLYHIANSGRASFYDLVSQIVTMLGTGTKITRAKDKDFQTMAPNSLKTAMKSVKLQPLRSWQDALGEYLTEEVRVWT